MQKPAPAPAARTGCEARPGSRPSEACAREASAAGCEGPRREARCQARCEGAARSPPAKPAAKKPAAPAKKAPAAEEEEVTTRARPWPSGTPAGSRSRRPAQLSAMIRMSMKCSFTSNSGMWCRIEPSTRRRQAEEQPQHQWYANDSVLIWNTMPDHRREQRHAPDLRGRVPGTLAELAQADDQRLHAQVDDRDEQEQADDAELGEHQHERVVRGQVVVLGEHGARRRRTPGCACNMSRPVAHAS